MSRRSVPWKKHGPPSDRIPLEGRTVEELDALIARNREPIQRMRQVKRLRRNKLGGQRRAESRQSQSQARTAQIVAAAEAFTASATTRFVPLLMARFSVSRSTVMRALRKSKVCHKPKSAKQLQRAQIRKKAR